MTTPDPGDMLVRGCCHVYCALDIGFSVDLKRCAGLVRAAAQDSGDPAATQESGGPESGVNQHHAPAPAYLNLLPAPVEIRQTIEPLRGSNFLTENRATITIYDFGAVSVEYRVPFEGTLEQVAALSSELYDNQQFFADARVRAKSLLSAIGPAVRAANLREGVEDYLVFEIPSLGDEKGPNASGGELPSIIRSHGQRLAQVLSSNTKPLSRQQRQEELSRRLAYYQDDLTIITWNAAVIIGTKMDDVLAVLELVNVQLRELHYLDNRLDDSLQESYDVRARARSVKTAMRRIRELMLDGQAFSEAVTNSFKPFPDAFLARVYACASNALGLNHFNQSIKEKLSLLNTVYTTLADEAAHERSLRLEWIVIILILIEVVMGFWEKLLPLWHRG